MHFRRRALFQGQKKSQWAVFHDRDYLTIFCWNILSISYHLSIRFVSIRKERVRSVTFSKLCPLIKPPFGNIVLPRVCLKCAKSLPTWMLGALLRSWRRDLPSNITLEQIPAYRRRKKAAGWPHLKEPHAGRVPPARKAGNLFPSAHTFFGAFHWKYVKPKLRLWYPWSRL